MKNKNNIGKYVVAFFAALALVGIVRKQIRDNRLERDFQLLDSGQIINITTGGYTGGGLTYTFNIDGQKYKRTMSFNGRCENLMLRSLSRLKKNKFQIIFQTGFPENSRILLLKSQYEKYGLEVPKELKEIVEEISKCE